MRTKRPKRIAGKKTNAGQRSLKWLRDRGWHAEMVEHYVHRPQGAGQAARFAGGYRKDCGGFIDILAWRDDEPGGILERGALLEDGGAHIKCDPASGYWCKSIHFLAVQATSRQQIAPHIRAYRDVEVFVKRGSPEQADKKRAEHAELIKRMLAWINAPGGAFVIHGWEPVEAPTKKGGVKCRWELTIKVVTARDLIPEATT
jgi:hypothetical protein